MDWLRFLHEAYHHVLPVLPWLIGGATVAIVSTGPIGRAIARRLNDGNLTARRSAELMDEVVVLRADVADMMERLDDYERALCDVRASRQAPRIRRWDIAEERVKTPTTITRPT